MTVLEPDLGRCSRRPPKVIEFYWHLGYSGHGCYFGDFMDYTVVKKPAMMVVGIECRTSNTPDGAPVDIPKLWGRVYGEHVLERIQNKISNDVVALYCDYEGDYTKPYSCVIGCQVSAIDQIPEGMVAKELPATSYVVFAAKGKHPEAVMQTWAHVWQSPLDRTYTGDFEVYGEKFAASPQEVDIYIAITSTL